MLENSNKKIITFLIVTIILVVIAIFAALLYFYLQTPEHKLKLGANIEEATIGNEGKTTYIKLTGESDKNITKIKFIFKDNEGNEYNYETSEGTKEISVPFKRSFWDWLLGREKYGGEYDYEIKADEIKLNNFNNINEVSVVFEYKTETGDINETGIITSANITKVPTCSDKIKNGNETGIDCGGSCKACSQGGGGGGGSGGTSTTPCTSESKETTCGSWNCGVKKNNCNEDVDCGTCTTGTCENGSCVYNFCAGITECSDYTDENNCTSDSCDRGICKWNATLGECYNYKGNVYYCDPINGNTTTGDGSEANPWGTLQSVIEASKFNGVKIKSGDTVKLKTGFHGGFLLGRPYSIPPGTITKNTDYITIEADTDAVADVSFVIVEYGSYWHFKGLRVSPSFSGPIEPGPNSALYIMDFLVAGGYSSNHIIVEDCNVFTVDNSSLWSPDDWNNLTYSGIKGGTNTIYRNNLIRNVGRGILVYGESDDLIENNTIDGFCGDGVLLSTSNIIFQDNRIVNVYEDNNPDSHSDAIHVSGDNIIVRRNYITTNTDPNRIGVGFQGIYQYGNYPLTNSIIENNVVMANNEVWGITIAVDSDNVKIINNTVVHTYNNGGAPDIDTSISTTCTNIEIRNNIADKFPVSNSSRNIVSDHNLKITNYNNNEILKFFVDYPYGDVRPLATSPMCNGSINPPGVAVGALPCVCTNDSQCEEVFGNGYSCDVKGKCVNGTAIKKTNKISQFNITWYFDKEYEYGTFANGDYWVVGPVNIISISPGWDGVMHGSMINPMSKQQAYDSRLGSFNSSLLVQAPVTLQPNSSLISAISFINCSDLSAYCPSGKLRPVLKTAAVLTVLDSVPPDNGATVFRPPYSGNKKPLYSVTQLRKDLLPNLPSVSSTLDIRTVADRFERVWLDHFANHGDAEQYTSPSYNMPNYGRDYSRRIGDASLLLMLDEQELVNKFGEDKDTLLIRFVQLGIDLYETVENGNYWWPGGGLNSGRKWPILFAGLMLDNAGMKNIGNRSNSMPYEGFAEDGQTFYVSNKEIYIMPYSLTTYGSSYSTGTVNVINGSNLVEGVGTSWVNDSYANYFAVVGDDQAYKVDGKAYKIKEVIDGTHLELKTNYTGKTATDKSYRMASFVFYGHGNGGKHRDYIEYTDSHLGMPEWGNEPKTLPYFNALDWDESYRVCCTAKAWAGFVLSAHIMNAKELWENDALFDYQDRFQEIQVNGQLSTFAENMWDAYRLNYGCIWTRDNSSPCTNTSDFSSSCYSQGHYNCFNELIKCEWQNSNCSECILASSCSNYSNQRACEYDPCQLKNCSWDGSSCVSKTSGSSASLSPFAKIWNFFKSLLTAKTGNAITGNVVERKAVANNSKV